MKVYLAAPLFTRPEREWNAALAAGLRSAGHEVFLPQASQVPNPTAQQIFDRDVEGLEWSDAVVAVLDGAEPDSGTAWECGYAYARAKPIVTFRSDIRRPGEFGDVAFNLMLWCSAGGHIELPLCTVDAAVTAIDSALRAGGG